MVICISLLCTEYSRHVNSQTFERINCNLTLVSKASLGIRCTPFILAKQSLFRSESLPCNVDDPRRFSISQNSRNATQQSTSSRREMNGIPRGTPTRANASQKFKLIGTRSRLDASSYTCARRLKDI